MSEQLNQFDLLQSMEDCKHDLRAFKPIYETYVNRIFNYCRHRVGTEQDAEDLTSQVFSRAMSKCHTFNGDNVGAWLFRIAYHLTVDFYRARSTLSISDEELTHLHDNRQRMPLDLLIDKEQHAMLQRWVDELEEDKRNLLLLRLTGELSAEEIGVIVGKSAGAVRTEIYRIIQRLKQHALQDQ